MIVIIIHAIAGIEVAALVQYPPRQAGRLICCFRPYYQLPLCYFS